VKIGVFKEKKLFLHSNFKKRGFIDYL